MACRLGDPKSMAYALVSRIVGLDLLRAGLHRRFPGPASRSRGRPGQRRRRLSQNFYLAILAWDAVNRGRSRRPVRPSAIDGQRGLDERPEVRRYTPPHEALIAILSDNYEAGLEIADFGITSPARHSNGRSASSARNIALVLLNKPGALDEVGGYIAKCAENGWTLFLSGPDNLLGRRARHQRADRRRARRIEETISRREKEGYRASADWGRMFLCEVYLEILSGAGKSPLGLLLRNCPLVDFGVAVWSEADRRADRTSAVESAVRPGRTLSSAARK